MTNDELAEIERLSVELKRLSNCYGNTPMTPEEDISLDNFLAYGPAVELANGAAALLAEVRRLQAENAQLRDGLCSMVAQHCGRHDSEQLDDWALSANEEALEILEQLGDVVEVRKSAGRYEWAGRMLPAGTAKAL